MKKDTRPLEERFAELTRDQKRRLTNIYQAHLLVTVAAVLIALIAVVVSHVMVVNAEDEREALKAAYMQSYMTADFEAYRTAAAHHNELVSTRTVVWIAASIFLIAVAIASSLVIKIKFPFYDEKLYLYMKKRPRKRPVNTDTSEHVDKA